MSRSMIACGNFILDAFLLSFVFVLLMDESVIPLHVIWLAASILLALVVGWLSAVRGYRLPEMIVSSVLVMGGTFFLGVPIWISFVFILFSVNRLHARFNDSEATMQTKSSFLKLLPLVFFIAWTIQTFVPSEETLFWLFILVCAGLTFYIFFRFVSRSLQAEGQDIQLRTLALYPAGIVLPAMLVSVTVFLFSETGSYAFAMIFKGLFAILWWPFSPLYDAFMNSLGGLMESGERAQGTVQQEQQLEEQTQSEIMFMNGESPEAPVAAIVFIALALATLALIIWLRRLKKVKRETLEASAIVYETTPLAPRRKEKKIEQQEERAVRRQLHAVRIALQELQRSAEKKGKGRLQQETVSEWFERMDIRVSAEFIEAYDKVRYGSQDIPAATVDRFQQEIAVLKENLAEKV